MLSQVRVRCATTPCATLFFPQLPAVAAAHGDVQRLRVQAEEGLLLRCRVGRMRELQVWGGGGWRQRALVLGGGGGTFGLHAWQGGGQHLWRN